VTSSVTGGAFRLVQDLIGPGKASELLFTGEYIDGKEAERIGLVNKAVPLEQLETEVRQMAQKIAACSAISLKLIKKGLLMARGEASLEALMDFEIEACLTCVSSKERQESLKTFEERKRSENGREQGAWRMVHREGLGSRPPARRGHKCLRPGGKSEKGKAMEPGKKLT